MAKVTGPLHSLSASGKFGQALCYHRWKGQTGCSIKSHPKQPTISVPRARHQGIRCRIRQAFCKLSTALKNYLSTATKGKLQTPFGLFTTNMYGTLHEVQDRADHWWAFDALTNGLYRDYGKLKQDLINIDTTLTPGIIGPGIDVCPASEMKVAETASTIQLTPSHFSIQFYFNPYQETAGIPYQIRSTNFIQIDADPGTALLRVKRVGGWCQTAAYLGEIYTQWHLLSFLVTNTYQAIYLDKTLKGHTDIVDPVLSPTDKLEIWGRNNRCYKMDELIILKEHDPILDLADFMTYEY